MQSQTNKSSSSPIVPMKRFRRDELADPTNPEPSLVVHVRNLNPKATEADLIEALGTFGLIAYVTVIPAQKMALVEFEDIKAARDCVTFAASNLIFVAGDAALFNYSTSQNIQRLGFESENPCKVLVITVYNAQYPIDVHVIHQICEPHAKVLRIAIVRKSMMQALVEFESAENAKKVKHAINGADIYSGCCTLKVEFAKPEYVKVTRQDGDQWDYTLGEGGRPGPPEPRTPRKTLLPGAGPSGPAGYGYPKPGYPGRSGENGYPPDDHYGFRGSLSLRGYDTYRGAVRGRGGPRQFSDYPGDYGDCEPAHYPPLGGTGCVLMIYGIDHEKLNCEKLFNLLCQYGNVLRIRFMATKKDTAMAELGTPTAVGNALKYLQGVTLFGLTLQLKPSIQAAVREVTDPFELPDGSPSFRDYSMSALQRFSTPDQAARNRLIYPTNVLHWYNAPVNMDEAKIRQIFAERNAPELKSVTVFVGKSDRSSSGLVELESIEKANEALALANHTPVVSPLGKTPYIVKLAYATPSRRRDDLSEEAGGGDDGSGGSARGGFRGGFRGSRRGMGNGYRGGRGGHRGISYVLEDFLVYGTQLQRMGAKEEAKRLIARRDQVDAEIENNLEVLKRNDCTMDSPLVDKEGFPFSHIDVYSVRQARHNIICLRNDRKALTDEIEKAIERSHAEVRKQKSESGSESDEGPSGENAGASNNDVAKKLDPPPVHRTSNKPFIKVTTVIPNSPAAQGGLRADDLIIQYGDLHAGNFKEMKEVSNTTAKFEGQKLRVTVLRNGRAVRLEIYPKRWSGNGILGCSIVPTTSSDEAWLALRYAIRWIFSKFAIQLMKAAAFDQNINCLTPNMVGAALSWGLYMQWYHKIKAVLPFRSPNENIDNFLIGFVAGSAVMCCTNPIWVTKTRLCLQYETGAPKKYSGMVDCLKTIYKEEGIRGLYRGFIPGLFGTIHGALQFMIYNRMKAWRCERDGLAKDAALGQTDYLMFSALSKIIATTATFPYQVLRTRMQDHNVEPKGVWRTTADTVTREGVRGLYKGCLMANLRQLPAAVVTFVTYENVRRYIKNSNI
ncbi:HnRNP-L/PTB/hephaestus splicing factor family protein [Trichostrongylus colubriformis]|uniref:HnRNP-L/PTB/hephaestus splicing factor family protein n=2 Tax=Trichostrongylus colubriformis TaxID=6319 RepID=A0AAN8FCT0_TRICO